MAIWRHVRLPQGLQGGCKRVPALVPRGHEIVWCQGIDYLDQIMLDYPTKDASSILGQRAFEEMLEQDLTKILVVSTFSPGRHPR